MIADESIERVRESADIVGIIGEYVNLKRQGTDFRGPCPFHQGTNRNFSVSPKKAMYHCFVCGESGDVFTFLMKRLGMDWPSAVRAVAEKSGIEIVETANKSPDEKDTREPFWEANAAAAEFFRRMLWEDEGGASARAYLDKRQITRDLADRVSIGFAPREFGALRAHLNTLGFADDMLVEVGLLVKPDDGAELRSRFRDRLMFPIFDVAGRAVGFGGRLMGPGEPKYLNTAESPVFSKGRTLYGLNWARHAARRDERMLVVEGYFDAIRLIGAGVESVVAPMGTALTEEQAQLIKRYTNRVYLLYDSDKAGLKATFRSGDELLRQGVAVHVVTLPDGEDPDTYALAHGAAGIEAQLGGSIDIFERKIQILERGAWFADLRKKRQALDRLLPTLRATSDPITRDLYVNHASAAAGVSKELLERELAVSNKRAERLTDPKPAGQPRRPATFTVRQGDRRQDADKGARAERELVRVLLHQPQYVAEVLEKAGLESFLDPELRQIVAALVAEGEDFDPQGRATALTGDAAMIMQTLLNEAGGLEAASSVVRGCLAVLQNRDVIERLEELDRITRLAPEPEKLDLLAQKADLAKEGRQLNPNDWKAFRRKKQ